jgi:hypothetical protein
MSLGLIENTKSQNLTELSIRADIVIDTVGGKNQDQLFGLLKPGGIIVSSVVRPNTHLAKQHQVQSDYLIFMASNLPSARITQPHSLNEIVSPSRCRCRICDSASVWRTGQSARRG